MSKPKQYKSVPKPGSRRYIIQQFDKTNTKRWAVFCRSPSGQSAKFVVLHEEFSEAIETARKHAATTASHGHLDFTYFVVELKHKVGIEDGKVVDIALEG